jgi:hypothetical protein
LLYSSAVPLVGSSEQRHEAAQDLTGRPACSVSRGQSAWTASFTDLDLVTGLTAERMILKHVASHAHTPTIKFHGLDNLFR